MGDLTARQTAFVAEYLIDLNGAQAAIRAGYSAKTAPHMVHRLLSNVAIQTAIQAGQATRAMRTEVTADRVLRELSDLALYDPADIAGAPMAGPEDIAALPERVRRAVVGWGWDKAGNFTLKLAPKTQALELIGRHLSMFRDNNVAVAMVVNITSADAAV